MHDTVAAQLHARITGNPPVLRFSSLDAIGFVSHAFALRVDDSGARCAERVNHRALRDYHEQTLRQLGFSRRQLVVAEQVHGNAVAVVTERPALPIPGVDGLLTNRVGLPLGIHVADCCAVFIVDRVRRAIALLHSGKLGTQHNIVREAMVAMRREFETEPADCLAALGPSIGPCHYDMDIWSCIESQLAEEGVREIVNPRICTACHLDRFYSYRAEKGRTGRMLAVLAIQP